MSHNTSQRENSVYFLKYFKIIGSIRYLIGKRFAPRAGLSATEGLKLSVKEMRRTDGQTGFCKSSVMTV